MKKITLVLSTLFITPLLAIDFTTYDMNKEKKQITVAPAAAFVLTRDDTTKIRDLIKPPIINDGISATSKKIND